ncbi:MAG: hypothetical protein HUJ28_02870 [Chromatiales bacterium]|nr:hypothetical protein [Chromatiales bacterium]
MRLKLTMVLGVLALVTLAGCSGQDDETAGETAQKENSRELVLHFQESEPGIEPYPVRMLVTPGFLRIDDGVDDGGFVLYDRSSRQIYSVSHEARQILFIEHRDIAIEPPHALVDEVAVSSDPQAPTIGGRAPMQVELTTNGELCHELVAVEGLLEEARLALIEYHETLAGEQAVNLNKTPVEYQTDCMLSSLVFGATRYLDHGFPIQERSYNGYTRALVDYEEYAELSPELFVLPDYRHYSITPLEDEPAGESL